MHFIQTYSTFAILPTNINRVNKIGLFVKKQKNNTKNKKNQTKFQKLNIITSSIAELSDYFELSDANKLATVNSHSSKSKKPLT